MAMATASRFLLLLLLADLVATSTSTTLTLHNLCPYPIWPLATPNSGLPSISNNTVRLDTGGLLSVAFPPTFWAGRVVPRTGCADAAASRCETGNSPPFTVAQLTVHDGGNLDLATYSVSLIDGFNVPLVVSPQAVGGGQCPVLGCTVDLTCDCPREMQVADGAACRGPAKYFKDQCPFTRTTATDVEPVPQSCRAPGELKIVFCQSTMVGGGMVTQPELVVRAVIADS